MHPITQFLTENFKHNIPTSWIASTELGRAYTRWLERNEISDPVTTPTLIGRTTTVGQHLHSLRQQGWKINQETRKIRGHLVRGWRGLQISNPFASDCLVTTWQNDTTRGRFEVIGCDQRQISVKKQFGI